MTDILKRSAAPISDKAWQVIDAEAKRSLKGLLSARALVDFSGPHGWELGSLNLGRLEIPAKQSTKGVHWGMRKVLPLVEVRVPFRMAQMELDSITRGSADPDVEDLHKAAMKIAQFEESAVYHGFSQAGIKGVLEEALKGVLALPKKPGGFAASIEDAVKTLQVSGVGGPYALVLGTEPYVVLQKGSDSGYPLRKRVEGLLLGGGIHWSPALKGGILLSTRGGDFELTVGQDLSIGYASHDRDQVELYLTESFTFRVLEPAAAVGLEIRAK